MTDTVHRLAIAALAVVTVQNVHGVAQAPNLSALDSVLQPLFAAALWGFLIWKLWHKARKWGLGIGVFLITVITFQTHLWLRAIRDPNLLAQGFDTSWTRYLLAEGPLAAAAVLCICLRWCGMADRADRGSIALTKSEGD